MCLQGSLLISSSKKQKLINQNKQKAKPLLNLLKQTVHSFEDLPIFILLMYLKIISRESPAVSPLSSVKNNKLKRRQEN